MVFDEVAKVNDSNVKVFLIMLVTLWSSYLAYTRWKKPHKKLPGGPVGLPFLGYLPFLGPEPYKTMAKLSKKYGNVISLYLGSKYTVVINDYEVAKETFSHPAALDRESDLFQCLPCIGFEVQNGEEWNEQRRFCVAAIKELRGTDSWESVIMDDVIDFRNHLKSYKGEPADIANCLMESVTTNMMHILIGREAEKDNIQLSIQFSDTVFSYMGPSKATSLLPGLRKYLEYFRIAGYDQCAKLVKNFGEFMRNEITRHKTSPEFSQANDFINSYLAKQAAVEKDKKKHFFSEINLEGNLTILFLASTDTVVTSLCWAIRQMAVRKDVQQRVYEELSEVLGKDGVARYDERHTIPYTFAVLMELQRYHCIVPLSTTRRAYQDIEIEGYTIPKGADFFVNVWALHNDPNYWDEPEKFRPERFLTNDGTALIKAVKSYAPFSLGRRNCPFSTVAWMEMLSYFTEIVRNFEITTAPGVEPKLDVIIGLVNHPVPQDMCFKSR